MEFNWHCLPMEWEERWRREKERRKRVIEEGGEEGIEQDKRELRRIVAYNDSRMGLTSGRGGRQRSEVRMDGTSQEAIGDEGLNVHTYHSQTYPNEVFIGLKEFWDSSLLTDLTLTTCNGNSFDVHSPILAAVSAVICERLRDESGGRSDNDGEVQRRSVSLPPDVDDLGLQAVLEFAYTGAVLSLDKDNKASIMAAARALDVPRVLDLCNNVERMKSGGSPKKKRMTSTLEQMKTTLQSVEQLWAAGVGCDVVLDVDGALFRVHRVILAASSDYFRSMFTCGMRESHQTCIALPFLSPSELEALIGCSYTGVLPLSWDCVFEISCMALQLQFKPAISLCFDFMQQEMDASSCLDVASFAEAYEMPALLEEANDFVLRNFWEVSATSKFQDLPSEKLLDILRCDDLCVPSELAVFRAVISWVESNPEERLAQAGVLMAGVRFPLMTFREFREVRAINLRLECFGNNEVELYGSAFKEFAFSLPETQDLCRVRRPKDAVVVVGGDQLNPDVGQRLPSRELWFANSLRSGIGLTKAMEWRRLTEIPDKPKFRHGVATMAGKLYVFGGCYYYSKNDMMKSAYSYDPVQDTWTRLADMLEVRSNFSAVVHGQHLYAIGGDKEINTNVNSVEMYNPDTDSWSFVQPLDQALSGHAATVIDGGIYISGGFNSKYVCLVSMSQYHPERGTTYLADMTNDRAQHCMEPLRGHLYVAGGVCNLRKFYTDQLACEVYDPGADSWTAFSTLPVPHVGAASVVLEGKIYILGGYCQEDYASSWASVASSWASTLTSRSWAIELRWDSSSFTSFRSLWFGQRGDMDVGAWTQDKEEFIKNMEDKLKHVERRQNDLEAKLSATVDEVERLKEENEGLKTSLNATEKEIEKLKQGFPQIAFSASLVNSGEIYRGPCTDKTLVFKRLFSNTGNGYDQNTGIFTAPVSGIYFFSFSTYGYNTHVMGAILMKNSVRQVSTYDSPTTDGSDSSSNAVVLQLSAGDDVYVELWDNGRVFDNLNGHTTFSGFLVFPV